MTSKLSCTCVSFLIFLTLLCGLSPGATEVIIDNGELGTSYTGTWGTSLGTGAWGVDSLWGRGGATYTWQTDQLDPGYYEVFMWWTQYTSRTDAAPVAIVHSAGTANVTVNQQINGSVWNSLGTFYFNGTGAVTITGIGVFPVNTCADAVRFTQTTAPPPDIVIDNTDSNTSRVGTWGVSGAPDPYGADSVWSRTTNNSFTWNFNCTERGYYNVSMWWTYITSRSTAAPVQIQTALGVQSLTVNQQLNAGMWNLLGEYFFEVGTYSVTIRTPGDNSSVCADAVGFTKTSTPPPPPPSGIIIDNADASTSRTGTWLVSGGTGCNGADSLYCRAANASFSWNFTPAEDGYYNVLMWWTEFSSRSAAAPVEILDSNGVHAITVNQQTGGSAWNLLGEYLFYSGTTYRVTIRTLTDSSSICADAVCFSRLDKPFPPPPPPPTGTIIDNSDANCSRVGTWPVSGGTGCYGANSLYCRAAGSSFTWIFTPTETAYYDVYMWWTEFSSRSAAAPVEIQTADGLQTLTVNQQTNGSKWNLLSTCAMNAGTSYQVTIRTLADSSSICADAVRFEKSTAPPPPPSGTVIDNTDANTELVGAWPASGAPDPYGTNSVYCRTAGCSFSWIFTPTKTAYYNVMMWWTFISSRSAAAPVEIQNADGTAAITVNQQLNGGMWNELGSYPFTAGTAYRVTIRTLTDNSSICADAVRFVEGTPPPPTGIVIDNRDTTVEMVGTWPVSAGLNPYGTDSVWCRAPNCSFTWLFTPPEDAYYNVFMWWTDSTSRSTAVPVEIQNVDGTEYLTVNQLVNYATWNELGEYPFYGGVTYKVTVRTLADNTSVCADAVMFEKTATPPPPPPPPPTGTIIDNSAANTSRVGTWPVSGGVNAWAGNSLYCRTADCSFSWQFTPEKTAYYEVFMWWTEYSSRSAVTPVEIQNAGGTELLTVNQQTNGGKWNSLGTFAFNAGTPYNVTIRTLTDNSAVCADAVRFVETTPPQDIIIDNRDAQTSDVGTWSVSGAPNPYGADAVYCRAANCSFTWSFTPTVSATYNVSMWWTQISSRSTAAPVEIQYAGGTASTTVNQQIDGGMWNALGSYQFEAGNTYNITIRTLADNSSICADAVRFTTERD